MIRVDTPTGIINGINKLFTVTSGTLNENVNVCHNGLVIPPSDTLSGFSFVQGSTIFTMVIAPQTNDVILCIFDPLS